MSDKDKIAELEDEILSLQSTIKELNDRAYLADQEYEESIELYQNILDISMEMVILIDANYNIIDINQSAVKQLAYTDKVELLNHSVLKFFDSTNLQIFKNTLDSNELAPIEISILTKNNTTIPALVQSTSLEDIEDIEYVITFMDLTDVKKREYLLQQQSLQATMGFMMDEIAHQWKQPLGIISVLASELELKVDMGLDVTNDMIQNCSSLVEEQTKYLIETIDEFRKFFRKKQNIEENNILDMLIFVKRLLKNTITKNNIKLYFNVDENITIDIISIEFKHIFINLINNSIDAFNDNKIDLENRIINIDIEKNNKKITIYYTDNAGGIKDNIIKKIFDFNVTTKQRGTGVGLYMVKQIIEKNHGNIYVSNIENGAKFTIDFQGE